MGTMAELNLGLLASIRFGLVVMIMLYNGTEFKEMWLNDRGQVLGGYEVLNQESWTLAACAWDRDECEVVWKSSLSHYWSLRAAGRRVGMRKISGKAFRRSGLSTWKYQFSYDH